MTDHATAVVLKPRMLLEAIEKTLKNDIKLEAKQIAAHIKKNRRLTPGWRPWKQDRRKETTEEAIARMDKAQSLKSWYTDGRGHIKNRFEGRKEQLDKIAAMCQHGRESSIHLSLADHDLIGWDL